MTGDTVFREITDRSWHPERRIEDMDRLGIDRQGATLRDYRDPSGNAGSMQDEFRVYGQAGEPCPRCATPIERIVLSGRGTWFCPACQR